MAWSTKCLQYFVLLVATPTIWAYHTGAPDVACGTMKPGHPFEPQNGKSPFRVIVAKTDVAVGEPVEMTLTAPSAGPPFKGFLVEVHPVNGDEPVGEFDPNSDENAQPVSCAGKTNSAMTHKDLTQKVQVKLSWTPPGEGEYKIVVTWVQQLNTFWVKETADGTTIKVTGGGGSPKTPGEAASEAKPKPEVNNNEVKRNNESENPGQSHAVSALINIPTWTAAISIFGTLFLHRLL